MFEVFSKTPWNIIFAQVLGAFVLLILLTLFVRRFFLPSNPPKIANFYGVSLSLAFCFLLTSFTGMGPERFYAYPTAAVLVFLALSLKK